jgi:hypothetical protein
MRPYSCGLSGLDAELQREKKRMPRGFVRLSSDSHDHKVYTVHCQPQHVQSQASGFHELQVWALDCMSSMELALLMFTDLHSRMGVSDSDRE